MCVRGRRRSATVLQHMRAVRGQFLMSVCVERAGECQESARKSVLYHSTRDLLHLAVYGISGLAPFCAHVYGCKVYWMRLD